MRLRALSFLSESEKALQGTAVRAASSVIRATPVDTSLARSNWVASVGTSADLSLRPLRSAADTIGEVRTTVQAAKFDSEIHIANGSDKVHYLKYLNAGSSMQHPGNFVKIAAIQAAAKVGGYRLLIMRRN